MEKKDNSKINKPKDVTRKNSTEDSLARELQRKKKNKDHATNISYSDLFNISKDLKYKSDIGNDIYDLFPDIKLTIELMVSSIISPNDDLKTNINYKLKDINLPIDLSMIISNTIKSYINKHYDMNEDMFDIIKKSMYIDGSYVKLILPLNTISNLISTYKITDGYESEMTENPISKNMVDSGDILDGFISLTDDFNLINVKDIVKKRNYNSDFDKLIPGFEANDNKVTDELMMLDTVLDTNNNKPLIKTIPFSKIIPIADVNDPSIHYGYLMILDSDGNHIDFDNNNNYTNLDASAEKNILTRANSLIGNKGKASPKLSNIEGLKEDLIIKQLKEKLKMSGIDDSLNQDVFVEVADVLFNRFIESKKSKVLFIPKQLVTYYAHEYNANGTGKPLLEKISVLASMRAITLFVTLLAYVKSSISTTNVEVDIDDDDDDYEATMEKVMTEVMKNRQLNLPIGILKVDDMTDWLHKIGFSFNFNHPGLPDTKVTVTEDKNDIDPINSDLLEKIDKQMIRALGATPEMVENSGDVNFATTIVNNNILFARRTLSYQKVYDKINTEHIKKVLKLDGNLKDTIYSIITDNLTNIKKHLVKNESNKVTLDKIKNVSDGAIQEYVYNSIIENICLELPKPNIEDNTKLEDQYSKFKDKVEDVIDVIFDEESLPDELVGDFSDKIDSLKKLVKTIIIKRWLIDNNYMTEVTSMFTLNNDGMPMMDILDEYSAYVEGIEKTIIPFITNMNKYKEKLNGKLEKTEYEEEEELPEEDVIEDVDDNTTDDIEDTSTEDDDIPDTN